MKRMSTRVQLTLALVVSIAGILGSAGLSGHNALGSSGRHYYMAGLGAPTPPKTQFVML